jgi:hypothetical protein
MQVFWFERWNLLQAVDVDAGLGRIGLLDVARTTMRVGVDLVDHAGALAARSRRRSRAPPTRSMPVPTSGASARSSGTA